MAINIPIITSLEDKGIKGAKTAFGDLKTAVAGADTGMGKLKAGSKVAMDSIKANAGNMAMMAGAAIAGFAVKAIGEFQDLAIAASKFSKATGLSVEDASKLMEAAGDIGIPVDALESAIGRLNRTIGNDPDKVRDLGVDLVYLNDGSLDVNKTFLNTIDRIKGIKDPAEKAAVATKLLGKGYQGMSELIEMGAGDLKKALDSVDDSKIIDEDEVTKAENYRAAMDTLRDSFEKMAINLGERLIPKVTQLVELLASLPEHLRGAGGVIEEAFSTEYMASIGSEAAITKLEFERLAEMYGGYYASRVQGAKDDTELLKLQMAELAEEVAYAERAFKSLKDELKFDAEVMAANETLESLKEKAIEAFNGADGALAEFDKSLIAAKIKILELAEEVKLSNNEANRIKVLVDTGDLDAAMDLILFVKAGGNTAAVDAMRYRGEQGIRFGRSESAIGRNEPVSYYEGSNPLFFDPKHRALGGPVAMGSSYLVGERGPELFSPSSSGMITPNNALGGNTITVNVNGGDPNQIVAALRRYISTNGTLPLAVR